MRPVTALRMLALAVAAGVCVVLAAPMLPPAVAAVVYGVCSLICHQRPDRSLYWDGYQMAVCARCTGLYLGAALGGLGAALTGPQAVTRWSGAAGLMALAAAVPTAVSVATEWTGMWAPGHLARLVAGVPLGWVGATVVAMAVVRSTLHYEP